MTEALSRQVTLKTRFYNDYYLYMTPMESTTVTRHVPRGRQARTTNWTAGSASKQLVWGRKSVSQDITAGEFGRFGHLEGQMYT